MSRHIPAKRRRLAVFALLPGFIGDGILLRRVGSLKLLPARRAESAARRHLGAAAGTGAAESCAAAAAEF